MPADKLLLDAVETPFLHWARELQTACLVILVAS